MSLNWLMRAAIRSPTTRMAVAASQSRKFCTTSTQLWISPSNWISFW